MITNAFIKKLEVQAKRDRQRKKINDIFEILGIFTLVGFGWIWTIILLSL
jgi:hypothetical protein